MGSEWERLPFPYPFPSTSLQLLPQHPLSLSSPPLITSSFPSHHLTPQLFPPASPPCPSIFSFHHHSSLSFFFLFITSPVFFLSFFRFPPFKHLLTVNYYDDCTGLLFIYLFFWGGFIYMHSLFFTKGVAATSERGIIFLSS